MYLNQGTETIGRQNCFVNDFSFPLADNRNISAGVALNLSNGPSDEDECILYGDGKLLTIHKTLAVEASSSPILLKEFHQFKCHGRESAQSAHYCLHASSFNSRV